MKPTRAELLDVLVRCEQALAKTREHNPWDLGPSQLLTDVRRVISKASPAPKDPARKRSK